MAPLAAGQPAWDPAQLEAMRLVVGANDVGPPDASVQRVDFE
jgi:hypothetical protein